MKQGNQFYLELQLTDEEDNILDIISVNKVEFYIDKLTKIYDGVNEDVLYDEENQCFKIYLTQEETFEFDKEIKVDARVFFKGEDELILGAYITSIYVFDCLKEGVENA